MTPELPSPEDPRPFEGASGIGEMQTGPQADALSILQRVRDGLLASSTEGRDAA